MKTTTFLTTFNATLVRASRLADALITMVDSYRNALALEDCEVIDLRDNPKAQPSYALTDDAKARLIAEGCERLPRRVSPTTFDEADLRVSRLPILSTDLVPLEVRRQLDSILALKAQARLISVLAAKRDRRALTLAPKVLDNLAAEVAKLEAMDPLATEYVVREFVKAHVADFDEGCALDVTGFHQTDSALGDSTTIRYDDSREIKSNNKGDHFHAGVIHTIDEDAMLEELRDLDSES